MLVIMHLVYLPRLENSYENIKFYPISLCARFSFTLRSDPLTMGHEFPKLDCQNMAILAWA